MRRNPHSDRRRPVLLTACLAGSILVSIASSGSSDEIRGALQVRVSVLPRTDFSVQAPPQLRVNTAARGSRPNAERQTLVLRARSNAPHGLQIELAAPAGMFAAIRVAGPDIEAELPGEGGTIVWRWPSKPGFSAAAQLPLQLTLEVADGVAAGTYDWPIVVTAAPLPR